MLKWFMERMVERIVPIIAKSFSSTVETLHALGQAEQQNELEEAARRYESQGKLDIAASLRDSAARLTSNDPAAQAVDIFQNIAGDGQRMLPPGDQANANDLAQLPDFGTRQAKKQGKKPRRKSDSDVV